MNEVHPIFDELANTQEFINALHIEPVSKEIELPLTGAALQIALLLRAIRTAIPIFQYFVSDQLDAFRKEATQSLWQLLTDWKVVEHPHLREALRETAHLLRTNATFLPDDSWIAA